jgi:outer membrane biosynthesis protein TonB
MSAVSTHRRPRTRVAITAGRLGIGLAVLVALLMAPVTVLGHSGFITASQNCETFDVRVFLNNDVTEDRTVTVTTTIPGTTGTTKHVDTTDESEPVEILHLNGDAPKTGTVTLSISPDDFVRSASIEPASNCEEQPTPTPEATPTPAPEATPTPAPEATPTPAPEATPTPAPEATPTPAPEATPTPGGGGGGVGGVTGTPRPRVTLPPTDTSTLPTTASREPSIVAVLFVMVAASAIATIALRPRKRVRVRDR